MNWFLLATLFFLLSPGVIITLPPGKKGLLFSGQTSVTSAIVHALVFVVVTSILKKCIYLYEGFNCGDFNCEESQCNSCRKPKNNCGCKRQPRSEESSCGSKKPSRYQNKASCRTPPERTWSEFLFGDSTIRNI
jgi:hypothetical protein